VTDHLLDSIEVEGFTSIRSARVSLGDLNVLIGANGVGKSNFVRALEMLGRIADGELGLFVGFNGGASSLVNRRAVAAKRIRLRVHAPRNDYEAVLAAGPGDELIFESESIISRGQNVDQPLHEIIGRGHRETRLHQVPQAMSFHTSWSSDIRKLLGDSNLKVRTRVLDYYGFPRDVQ
jgi:predicted ATPase